MVDGRAHVESGAADEDGTVTAAADIGDGGPGAGLEVLDVRLGGDVEGGAGWVRDPARLLDRQFRGADVHAAIELHRVRVDDLPAEVFGQVEREIRLPGGGGPDDGDDRRLVAAFGRARFPGLMRAHVQDPVPHRQRTSWTRSSTLSCGAKMERPRATMCRMPTRRLVRSAWTVSALAPSAISLSVSISAVPVSALTTAASKSAAPSTGARGALSVTAADRSRGRSRFGLEPSGPTSTSALWAWRSATMTAGSTDSAAARAASVRDSTASTQWLPVSVRPLTVSIPRSMPQPPSPATGGSDSTGSAHDGCVRSVALMVARSSAVCLVSMRSTSSSSTGAAGMIA